MTSVTPELAVKTAQVQHFRYRTYTVKWVAPLLLLVKSFWGKGTVKTLIFVGHYILRFSKKKREEDIFMVI